MANFHLKEKKKIAIVDDHSLFRLGFSKLIQQATEHQIIFDAENGKELIEKLKTHQPDIIFLDLEMPVMNGIDSSIFIKQKYPEIKIIIVSMHQESELIEYLLEKGVNGFISKNADLEIILKALHSICTTGYYVEECEKNSASIKEKIDEIKAKQIFRKSILSQREIEVMKLMCNQYTNRQIADLLCVSPRTVETYRVSIFNKTKSKNIAGVVLFAVKNKLFK